MDRIIFSDNERRGKEKRKGEAEKEISNKEEKTGHGKLKTENNAKATEYREGTKDRQEKRRGAETDTRTGRFSG